MASSIFDSVRTRLTLWYAGVLALSLIAFAFLVYYAAASIFYERQDESLRSTAQTVASAYAEELEEAHSVSKAGQIVLAELVFPNRYVQVTDTSGTPIASSKNISLSLPSSALEEARRNSVSLVTVNDFRIAVVPLGRERELGYAAVAEPLSVIEIGLKRLRQDFFAGVPIVLLFASVGGYFLARKSLRPIESMNRQTQRISAERLSSRLDVSNPRDELGSLALTINDLLCRLENSFKLQQQFIADASHELRTPLAVLRGETEVALTKSRTVDEYQQSLSLIAEEAQRLSHVVENLFILARQPIDAPAPIFKEPVSLNDAVSDCARAARVLASQKGVRLVTEIGTNSIVINGDDELIKRMILNLLDNAVKYTPENGEISVGLTRRNGSAEIIVSDTGIGIPPSAQPHVFDRFYRVDKARSRALGGAGLGLSIVAWIVKAHGGSIAINSSPGVGSKFTVKLPVHAQSLKDLEA